MRKHTHTHTHTRVCVCARARVFQREGLNEEEKEKNLSQQAEGSCPLASSPVSAFARCSWHLAWLHLHLTAAWHQDLDLFELFAWAAMRAKRSWVQLIA